MRSASPPGFSGFVVTATSPSSRGRMSRLRPAPSGLRAWNSRQVVPEADTAACRVLGGSPPLNVGGCRGALRVMVCSSVQFVGPFVLGDIATRHIDVPHVTAARTGVIRACRRSKRGDYPRRPASRAFVDGLRRHARFHSISSAIPTAAFESRQCDSTRRPVWRVSATSPNPSRWGREQLSVMLHAPAAPFEEQPLS